MNKSLPDPLALNIYIYILMPLDIIDRVLLIAPNCIYTFLIVYIPEKGGRTVAAMDVLVPKIGELVGGSQREERREVLQARIAEMGLSEKSMW